jgi:predicted LPLAT superfamily acyltransferase
MPQRAPESARSWDGRSHGGDLGHRLVESFARYGGATVCYLLLIPPTCWFFWRLHERRRLVARYWRRMRPGLGRWGCLVMAWRHFYSFARMLADRFLVSAAPRSLRHRSLGYEVMRRGMASPQGCVMLSAHVGNWELSGRWLSGYRLGPFNLVMLENDDPRIAARVKAALGTAGISVIDLAEPFAASLAIAAALRRGETCCMLGDRTAGAADHTVAVPFCGGTARFPTGPFLAAAVTGAAVMPVFCIKTGWRSYATFALEPWTVRFSSRTRRQQELHAAVARWARCLERMLRRYPMQWHNFYEFWAS